MRRLSTLSVLLIACAVLGFSSRFPAQTTRSKTVRPPDLVKLGTVNVYGGETPPGLTAAQRVRWDSFIKVWDTLNDNYFDRTFNGLDWNKIKVEYRPRVIAAKSDSEINAILDELIHRLNRSHFAIIPLEVFKTLETAKREARKRGRQLAVQAKRGLAQADKADENEDIDFFDENSRFGIGVEVRMLNGQLVVTSVDARSAAQLAGIKRGYIIDKINGVSVSEMIRRITFSYPNLKNLNLYLPLQIVSWFLDGPQDSEVSVIVSYEIPRVLSVVPVLMFYGTQSLRGIAMAQTGLWHGFLPRWFIFYPVIGQLAFLIFLISSVAETNRTPFDIPEAESELVAGFHTEFSGLKFALFFLAEYAYTFLASAMAVVLFFGGADGFTAGGILPSWLWFLGKTFAIVFLFLWFRWTFPRLRVDRLMQFCWKFLLPWSLVNIGLTGLMVLLRQ